MEKQLLIPSEVESLINVVAERWGYYFGKRILQSELMRVTKDERAIVKEIGQKISTKINEYLEKGVDVRDEIRVLQAELTKARATLKEKSEPFYEKIRPLNKALSYLDKEVIPRALEAVTGEKVAPRFQLSDYVIKALETRKR